MPEPQDDEDDVIFAMPDEIAKDRLRLAKSPPTSLDALRGEVLDTLFSYVHDLSRAVAQHGGMIDELFERNGGDGLFLTEEQADDVRFGLMYAKSVLDISLQQPGLTDEQRATLRGFMSRVESGIAAVGELEEDEAEEAPAAVGQA
jgi:hypothetical protein